MNIRKFRKKDASQTAEVIKETLRVTNSRDYSGEVIDNLIKHYTEDTLKELSKKRQIYIAWDDDVVVGTAGIEDKTVYGLFVHPDHQGKGIGGRLMDRIEKTARKEEIKQLDVFASITAYEFYEKRGYEKVQEIESTDVGTNILMRKNIS